MMEKIISLIKQYKIPILILQYIVTIAALGYLFFLMKDLQFSLFNPTYIVFVCLSILVMRFFSTARLLSVMKLIGRFNRTLLIHTHLIGVSLGLVTPAKSGESYKVIRLGRTLKTKKKITSAFLFEKIMDVGAYVFFGMLFALISNNYILETSILLGIVLVGATVYFKMNHYLLINPKLFFSFKNISLSILHYFAFLFSFWMILLAANIPATFYQASLIITLASVVGLLSTLPGGLGSREISSAALITITLGVDISIAGSIAIAHTFLNYATTWLLTIGTGLFPKKSTSFKD